MPLKQITQTNNNQWGAMLILWNLNCLTNIILYNYLNTSKYV